MRSAPNKMVFLLHIVVAALALNSVYGDVDEVPLPTIDLNEWWGPGNATDNVDTNIYNYTIEFSDTMVNDLISRLLNHRNFTPPLEDVAFNYGMTSTALEPWIQYLAYNYTFQERAEFLNQYPHYNTSIQGLNIHFMRVKSNYSSPYGWVPLMLLHGWPGSIRVFYECIPHLLSNAEEYGIALDIIVPSLPGYGFSDGAVRAGMGVDKMAITMRNLMDRIGYSQYYVQAEDLGSLIGSNMATFFPDEVLGYHTCWPLFHTPNIIFSLILGNYYKDEITTVDLQDRLYPSWDKFFDIMTETGYLHDQSTEPDTVGIGLTDSPSGLMGYTLEKFSAPVRRQFINCTDGCLTNIFTQEQLMDNYMIYWASNCITTSMRLFAETFNLRYCNLRLNEIKSYVPAWAIQAPDEYTYLPDWMIKQKFPNLLNVTLPSEGGHYYAWEQPQLFAEDVVKAIIAFQEWNFWNNSLNSSCTKYSEK